MTDQPPPGEKHVQPQPSTDPPLDQVAEDFVAASRVPRPPAPPPWVSLSTGVGLALVIIGALTFVGIVAQGMAIDQDTSVWYRQGIGFLRNLDASPIGLMLIAGIALIAVPVVVGERLGEQWGRSRQVAIALGLAAAIALLVAVGAVLGVVTRLHFDTGPGQEVTSATRRVLATFIVRNLGPALVAFAGALALVRMGSPRAVTPRPYRETGGSTGVDAQPGAGARPS